MFGAVSEGRPLLSRTGSDPPGEQRKGGKLQKLGWEVGEPRAWSVQHGSTEKGGEGEPIMWERGGPRLSGRQPNHDQTLF